MNKIMEMSATVRGHLVSQVAGYDALPSAILEVLPRLQIESPRRLLDLYLNEIGIIGFTDQIIHAISEINKACDSGMGCSKL